MIRHVDVSAILNQTTIIIGLSVSGVYKSVCMKKIFRIFVRQFFCLLARLCVLRHKPFVIGVTGSFGKTTVRHIITEILRRAGRDVYSPE